MSGKYFGSDGIRGLVGKTPITPDFILKLGWAAGKVFQNTHGNNTVLIGKDTRVSGYMLESALEAGFAAAGVNILLGGPLPSPAVAYLTQTFRCNVGIMITASHNLYQDNGIKFFMTDGSKLSVDIEKQIEAWMKKPLTTVPASRIGKAFRINDSAERYVEFCKSTLPDKISLKGVRLILDCANGAAYNIAPDVFSELGASVESLGINPNGYNINAGCGSTDTRALSDRVVSEGADLGVALDGDGDRVVLVDDQGQVLDGDDLLFILARARQAVNIAGVAGTVMTNTGLERALGAMSVPFERTAVGDKHIVKMLKAKGWDLGGESSGHILCLDLAPSSDAIIAGLQVMHFWLQSGQPMHEFRQGWRRLPQTVVNVQHGADGNQVETSRLLDEIVAGVHQSLGTLGRALVRSSGTEPVERIMIEAENETQLEQTKNRLLSAVATTTLLVQP